MLVSSTLSSVFAAVAALGAAAAAVAAWWAVHVETRARARDREPVLTIGLGRDPADRKRVRITIDNSGGGLAREVGFLAYVRNRVCVGVIPPSGTLGRDRRVILATELTYGSADISQAVVTCSWNDYLLAWDKRGQHHRIRLNPGEGLTPFDMFEHFYGELLAGKEEVDFRLEEENI
jgi:hypothetical protein